MAKQLQLRRGTTAQHSTFTGALAEITVDTDKKVAVIHDGTTAGGFPLARADGVVATATTANALNTANAYTGTSFNSITGLSSTTPIVAGTAAVGTATTAARADHVHPVQTTITGNAATATKLATARTIGMTGDVTWTSASFDGSGNVTGTATLANSGVTAGTYGKVTVDAKGRVTSGTTMTMEDIPSASYKKSVAVATTANITLSAAQTIDDIAVVAGDRVLVKNQTTASQNGIYVVNASTWTRALDADTADEIASAIVNVDKGTVNGGQVFTNTFKSTDTLDTTSMTWYRGMYESGTWGISVTGNASTATTLATARTINGVSFNGSANITVADSTKLPLAGGTLTGALAGTTFTGTSFNSITGLSSTTPIVAGTAAVGTATTAARADHVHGSDTTKVSKVSSTDNAIVRFDGTSGAVQNSGVVIDDSNNVGIGVTPSAWGSGVKAIEVNPGIGFLSTADGTVQMTYNAYYNSGWKYKTSAAASNYYQLGNAHNWRIAPSGTAEDPITWTTAMTLDASGNLLFNSGYGSVATAYGCRAWVNFNGTGTVAIRASGNVSSITDGGAGSYIVNFATAMPDTDYAVCTRAKGTSNIVEGGGSFSTYSTTSVQIQTIAISSPPVATDCLFVNVAIFR